MILQAWLTLPSCLANSSSPTLVRMIFWSRVIVGSSLTRFKNSLGADNQGNPLHVRFDLSFYNEIPSNRYAGRCGGQGIVQHIHRLSFREGSETALAKEGEAGT